MGSKTDDLYFTVPGFGGDAVFHGFFGRNGGVSKGIYSSLNCGPGSSDNPAHIKENRRIVAEAAGTDARSLLSLYQEHGNTCITVDEPFDERMRPQADGFVTDKPSIALGILTADCGPVLFYGQKDDDSPVIGAAHAGWGGALLGILEATIEQMEALGASKDSIVAAIGPCISQESYEVTKSFSEAFLEEDASNAAFFIESKKEGHLMFDLPGYIDYKLGKAGVNKVLRKELDTYFNEEDFFSYRRATHRQEEDYGRQISVVMIKPT